MYLVSRIIFMTLQREGIMKQIHTTDFIPVDISEHDVIKAMKLIEGYIDITPGDFKEVYQSAYAMAVERLLR